MENEKELTPAEVVGAMTDAEVDAALAELRGWKEVHTRADGIGGAVRVLGLSPNPHPSGQLVFEDIPRYTSPDCPHALRVELVEAVVKAGVSYYDLGEAVLNARLAAEDIDPTTIYDYTHGDKPCDAFMDGFRTGLASPGIFARGCLSALRAGEEAR